MHPSPSTHPPFPPARAAHATGLRCFRCGDSFPFALDAYTCPRCGDGAGGDPGVLDVTYDYGAAERSFPDRRSAPGRGEGIFRWRALLPVDGPAPGLFVGDTPLVPAPRLARRLGLGALYLKDDTRNPTRCFKDRATAVAVQAAVARGLRTLYCASAGNAAISLAGFCAHAGLECEVFVPAEVSAERLAWLRRYGARVRVSKGNYDQAFDESEAAGRAHGWYSRNCALNPFLVEGKKTAAFEVAEQLGWEAPDLVVAPVGDGCILGALGKGFRELALLGRTERLPRLVGVQSAAVRPVVDRWGGAPGGEAPASTRAASISVRRPRNALRLLGELEGSGGGMVAADDAEIEAASRLLATEAGVVVEFTTAATLAALTRLAAAGSLEGQTAVLVLTGGRTDGDT